MYQINNKNESHRSWVSVITFPFTPCCQSIAALIWSTCDPQESGTSKVRCYHRLYRGPWRCYNKSPSEWERELCVCLCVGVQVCICGGRGRTFLFVCEDDWESVPGWSVAQQSLLSTSPATGGSFISPSTLWLLSAPESWIWMSLLSLTSNGGNREKQVLH